MRIVAGELGGRRIAAPKGDAVRPTSDRVREALFSILGDVAGLRVLDLFCGTGALGLEAISRGAASTTLVDTDVRPARANANALGVADRTELVRADALAFLRRDGEAYDLVFSDPPYRLARRLAPQLDSLLEPRLRDGARVIFESAIDSAADLSLPLLNERTYGSTLIRIHGARR